MCPTDTDNQDIHFTVNMNMYKVLRSCSYIHMCRTFNTLVIYCVYLCSIKLAVEKAPLVIPLIQQNRWMNARKPEDLETDDGDDHKKVAVKVADVQQTGDRVTDAAVREILSSKHSLFSSPGSQPSSESVKSSNILCFCYNR